MIGLSEDLFLRRANYLVSSMRSIFIYQLNTEIAGCLFADSPLIRVINADSTIC